MKRLKELTQQAHDRIETAKFSRALLDKTLPSPAWEMFLYQKYRYTVAIERTMMNEMPQKLLRSPALYEDSSSVYPMILRSTEMYIKHLEALTPKELDAHLYVNYMGDLMGGQIIKKLAPGKTTHLDFENRSELMAWIKNRIDGRSDELVEEANKAFGFVEAIQEDVFNLTQGSID